MAAIFGATGCATKWWEGHVVYGAEVTFTGTIDRGIHGEPVLVLDRNAPATKRSLQAAGEITSLELGDQLVLVRSSEVSASSLPGSLRFVTRSDSGRVTYVPTEYDREMQRLKLVNPGLRTTYLESASPTFPVRDPAGTRVSVSGTLSRVYAYHASSRTIEYLPGIKVNSMSVAP